MENNGRVIYYDLLRIVATLAVIIIHTSSQNWTAMAVTSSHWQMMNFYDAVTRWSVPIFVMISGALFLKYDFTMKSIFKNNILRLVTSFIFWSVIYTASYAVTYGFSSTRELVLMIVRGHYHMWFIYMIIALYVLIPVLKKIAESDYVMRYFMLLSLIFTFIKPVALNVLGLYSPSVSGELMTLSANLHFHITDGFVFYFICGYYISKTDFTKKARYITYALSLASFAFTVLATSAVSLRLGSPNVMFYDYLSINVMFESVGIFMLFKYASADFKPGKRTEKIIFDISKYSFGIYLVHALILEMLAAAGISSLSVHPAVSIPLIAVAVFVISLVISFICNHIPILKKYIV